MWTEIDNKYFKGEEFHIMKNDIYSHVTRKRVPGMNRYRVRRGYYDGEWGETTYFSAESDFWARHYTFLLSRHLGWDGELYRINPDGTRSLLVTREESETVFNDGVLHKRFSYPLYLVD